MAANGISPAFKRSSQRQSAWIVGAARAAHRVAAAGVIVLVCVQVYLIASFIFGAGGALSVHMTVGRIAVGFELLVLLTALLGYRHDRTELRLSAALAVIGGLQVSLAADLGNSPYVHALHGLLAIAVLALAWRIVARTAHGVRSP